MIDKQLRVFAREVAVYLDGFREQFDEQYAHLAWIAHQDGRRLRLRRARDESRVLVDGDYPRGDYRLDLEDPRRTFALDRDPAAVAAEIIRFIMPGYVRDLKWIRAYLAQQEEANARHTANVTRLLDLIPNAVLPYGVGKHTSTIINWHSSIHGCWGDLQVNGAAETTVLTAHNVPIPILEQVMAVLTGPVPKAPREHHPTDA